MAVVSYSGKVAVSDGLAVGDVVTFFSSSHLSSLQALMPHGPAWNRTPGSVLTQLLLAASYGFARAERRAGRLLDEAYPLTTLEMLTDWEAALGITPTGSVDDRRQAIVAQLRGFGNPSQERFLEITQALGYVDIELERYDALVANDPVGYDVHDPSWRHRVDIIAHTLGATKDAELYRQFARIQPDHVKVGHIDPYRFVRSTVTLGGINGTGVAASVNDVAFVANGLFPGPYIAVGSESGGTVGTVYASKDARRWGPVSYPGGTLVGSFIGVAGDSLGNTLVVGNAGRVLTKLAGATAFTSSVIPGTPDMRGAATNGSRFVLVGSGGTIVTCDAPSYNVYTTRTPAGGYAGTFRKVRWSADFGKFFAVGDTGEIQYSTDGITWSRVTIAGSPQLLNVACFDGQVIAHTNGGLLHRSTNGTTFAAFSWSVFSAVTAVTMDYMGIYAASGNSGGAKVLLTSPNKGVTWYERTPVGFANAISSLIASGNAAMPRLLLINGSNAIYADRDDLENLI